MAVAMPLAFDNVSSQSLRVMLSRTVSSGANSVANSISGSFAFSASHIERRLRCTKNAVNMQRQVVCRSSAVPCLRAPCCVGKSQIRCSVTPRNPIPAISSCSSFFGAQLVNLRVSRRYQQTQSRPCRQTPSMSFLGVGAPEAILVAVVALIVFGPKGLAEAAKSVGTALRSFQPTIREVVEVSQDLRSTIEQELGIDELRQAARPLPRQLTKEDLTPPLRAVSEEVAASVDPEIEAKRAASAQMAWGAPGAEPPAPATAEPVKKELGSLSMEELEAELARRRADQQKQPSA